MAPLLMSYVSKYIKNIQPRDLNLSVWNGDVTLHKLDLRLDVIEQELKMPFKLLSGHINQLDLKIPWMTLGSEPVVVNISTIELVFTLKPAPMSGAGTSQEQTSAGRTAESRNLDPVASNLPPNPDQTMSSSYTQNFLTKIINNVSVNINNLILKYIEDDIVFSLNLTSLRLFTANGDWEPAFVDAAQNENLAVRKVCNIRDLTICLDKRNNNGVIESYQDPILYRCSFAVRTHITFDSPSCSRTKTVKVHVFFDSFELSISDVQLPMFLRLVSLIIEIYYGSLELPNRCVYIESDLSPSDRDAMNQSSAVTISPELDIEHNLEALQMDDGSENQEGWISWAWSRVPAVWNDPNAATSKFKTPQLMSIGVYAKKFAITFKPTYSTPSRKLPVEPILRIDAEGCGMDLQMFGLLFLSVDMASTSVTSSVHGFCPCGARDCSYDQKFTFFSIGEPLGFKVGNNYLTNSLFDDEAPENNGIQPSTNLDADSHFKIMTEERMRDVFGAYHFGYVFQLSANESEIGEIVYNPSERLLPYPEASWMKLTVYPCNLMITSSVVHRLSLVLQHASKVGVNYQPYSTPKQVVPNETNHRLPSNLEWSLLNKFISKRQKSVKVISPNVVISVSNHQHLESSLPLLYEDQTVNHSLPLLCLQANCDSISLNFTTPMYAKHVVGMLSLVPNLDKLLFDQCFATTTAKINKGTLSFCKLVNDPNSSANQKTFTSPVDISYTSSALLLQNFWKDSDLEFSNFYQLQTSPLELFLNKAQFLFLADFAMSSNSVTNPKTNSHLKLSSSSICYDIFDDSLPKLHLFSSYTDLQSYSKADLIVARANFGHLTAGYFQATQGGGYTQILKTESKNMPHAFIEVKASLPGDFQNLNVENNSFEINVSSFNASFVPALREWLCFDIRFPGNCNPAINYNSPAFFLYKGEQVFSNYCSASVILAMYEKPREQNYFIMLNKIKCLNFQMSTEYSQVNFYHPNGISETLSVLTISLPVIKLTSHGYNSISVASDSSASSNAPRTSGFPWYLNIPFLELKSDSETIVLIKTTSLNCAVTNTSKSSHHSPGGEHSSNVLALSCHFDCENVQILFSNSRLIKSLHCAMFLFDVASNVCTVLKFPIENCHDVLGSVVRDSMASPSIIWRTNATSDADSEDANAESTSQGARQNQGLEFESESRRSEHSPAVPQSLKVNMFLQATLNKFDLLLYRKMSEKPAVVATVNEISLIADKHSTSLQTKIKVSSLEVVDQGEKILSSDPWFRYDTFCHSVSTDGQENEEDLRNASRAEEFLRRFRQNNNRPREAFCSIIFTRALSRVILQKLANQTTKKMPSASKHAENNYVSEICVNMSSFDSVLLSKTISTLIDVFDSSDLQFGSTSTSSKSQAGKRSGKHSNVLCVRSLPLININFQESRVCIPLLDQSHAEGDNEISANCLLVQMESLQVLPHTDRPIQRTILKNSFYTKALLSGDINVPGSLVEDRQYSLTLSNFFIGAVPWEDLLLSPDKQKLEILDVHSQNPALEWNRSEYLQAIIRPLKMGHVLNNVSIRSEFAPAIVITRPIASKYTEYVVVSGHSAQMELTNINFTISEELLLLVQKLMNEYTFELPSKTAGKDEDEKLETRHLYSELETSFCSEKSYQQYNFSPVKRKLGTINEAPSRNAFVRTSELHTKKSASKKAIPIEALLILSEFEVSLNLNDELNTLNPLGKFNIRNSFVSYKSSENDLIEIGSYGLQVGIAKSNVAKRKSMTEAELFENVLSCVGSGRDIAPLIRASAHGVFTKSIDSSLTCKAPISLCLNPEIISKLDSFKPLLDKFYELLGVNNEKTNADKLLSQSSEVLAVNEELKINLAATLEEGIEASILDDYGHALRLAISRISSSCNIESHASVFADVAMNSIHASYVHPAVRKSKTFVETFDLRSKAVYIFEKDHTNLSLSFVDVDTDLVKLELNKHLLESIKSIASLSKIVSQKDARNDRSRAPVKIDSTCVAIDIDDHSESEKLDSEFSEGSEDDVRNGNLTYVSENSQASQFPGVNQVSFSDENDPETYMTWCYDSPRRLSKLDIAPMPFRTSFETKLKPCVNIELSSWDVAKQKFTVQFERKISEDEMVSILEPGSKLDVISPMWRLRVLNNELSTYPKQVQTSVSKQSLKLISAVSLAGAARVNSFAPRSSRSNVNVRLNSTLQLNLTALNACNHSKVATQSIGFVDVFQLSTQSINLFLDYYKEMLLFYLKFTSLTVDLSCDGFFQNIVNVPSINVDGKVSPDLKNVEVSTQISGVNVELSLPKLRAISSLNFADICENACVNSYLLVNNLKCVLVVQHPNLGVINVPAETQMPVPLPIESSPINVAINTDSNFAKVQLVRGQTKTVCLSDHRDPRYYSVSLRCRESTEKCKLVLIEVSNSFSLTNHLDADLKVVTDLLSPKNKVVVKSAKTEVSKVDEENERPEAKSIMLPLPNNEEIVLMHLSSKESETSTSISVLKPDPSKKVKIGTVNAVCKIEKSFAVSLYPQFTVRNLLPFELTLLCSNLSASSDSIAVHLKPNTTKQLLELDGNCVYEANLLSNTGLPLFSQPPFTFSSNTVTRANIGDPKLKEDAKKLSNILASVDSFEETSDISVNILTLRSEKFDHSADLSVFPKLVLINKSQVEVSVKRETHFGTNGMKLGYNSGALINRDCPQLTLKCKSENMELSEIVVELLQDEVPRSFSKNTNLGLKLSDSQTFKLSSSCNELIFLKLNCEILAGTRVVTIFEQFEISNMTEFNFKYEYSLCESKSSPYSGDSEIKVLDLPSQAEGKDVLNPWSHENSTAPVIKVLKLYDSETTKFISKVVLSGSFETLINVGKRILSLNLYSIQSGPDIVKIENCGQPGILCVNMTEKSLIIGSCKDQKGLPEELLESNCSFLTLLGPKDTKVIRNCNLIRICSGESSKLSESKNWSDHIDVSLDAISVMVPGIGCIYGQFESQGLHTVFKLSPKPFDILSPREFVVLSQATKISFKACIKSTTFSYFDCAISQEFPSEICRLTIEDSGLQVNSLDPLYNNSYKLGISIGSVQIDNQLAQSTSQFDFPVIFQLERPKSLNNSDDTELHAASLEVVIKKSDELFKVRSLKLQAQPMECLFEDSFFTTMMFYGAQVQRLMKSENEHDKSKVSTQTSSLLPVESIEIAPISVKLSLHANIKIYIALDQSPLYFHTFKKDFLSSVSMKRLGEDLMLHYGSGLFVKAGFALGSLDIIGNPMRFVSEFRTGLKDLVTMPYDGLTRGPTSFITGITGGGLSCVKHISSGALGCLVNLSFSIAKNLDRISMDAEYSNYQNQLRRHRPVYFSNGVVKGMTGFGVALLGAVAGVVNLPIETMTKADGSSSGPQLVGNMMKGVSAGLVGVLAKPIGGAADFLAHTGQGLMTTTGLTVEHRPKGRPKLQMNLMSCPTPRLFNTIITTSSSFHVDIDKFLVDVVVNATLSIMSTKNQLTICLGLCGRGLFIWLRHTIASLNMEPSFAFYPFHLVSVFEDKLEENKIFLQLDLSGKYFLNCWDLFPL